MPGPHNRFKPLAAVSVIAALAIPACTVGPNYTPPKLAIEHSYGPGAPQDRPTVWWHKLNDPALDQLIASAAQNNLDLRAAAARIREARAQRTVISGFAQPELNANGQYAHNRFSQNAAPFNAFDVPNFPWEYNLYELGFDASWEIDLFGGNRRAVEAATADLQSSREEQSAILVSLLAETARAYLELRGAQDQQRIAQQNLNAQQQTVDLTKARLNQGLGTDLDVTRAAAQVAQTAAQLPLFDRAQWQALHRLAVLTNQPLDSLMTLLESSPVPSAAEDVAVGIPADLLRRRPDIRRAERQLAAATAQIGVAEAQLYPKLSLTGYFNLQSASIEDLFASRSRAFGIGPTITWPILQAGRLRAAVDVRTAQQEEALVKYEQTVQQGIAEVRDNLVALQTERRRHTSLAQAVADLQQSFDLATQLYQQGLTDFLTVLDAQRQLLEVQDALSRSQTQSTQSLIALYKSLGGGWENELPAPPTQPALIPSTEPASTPSSRPTQESSHG